MWILTPLQPGGETHYLLSSKNYIVGRKNCEILLPNDQSISRVHAQFTAAEQTLTLKDSSKYGTFVNNRQLTENTPVGLKAGDSVTFGVFHSKFSVDHRLLVVCSSCVDNAGKTSLSQALLSLGGKLVASWSSDCTHLVMPTVKVTIKTISALLDCRPIVEPEYFSELCTAAQQHLAPPSVERFLPKIDEPSLGTEDVNLLPVPARKHLFSGKTFVFLSAKQLKRLSAAVSSGGGGCRLLDEGSLPRDLLESPQSCVIEASSASSQNLLPSSTVEWEKSVKNIVQRKALRLITESEIGLAAIYASCYKYCNPSSVTSESAPTVTARLPTSSQPQSSAVNETMLPAASQNITAYAVNTETSQLTEVFTEAGVTSVGETPEKNRHGAAHTTRKMSSQFVVADTMMSASVDTQQSHPRPQVSSFSGRAKPLQSPFPKPSDTPRSNFPNKSPQKTKNTYQSSPQKQSTLNSFFQPVSKKRPLDDDASPVMSEPKRPVLESSMTPQRSGISSREPGSDPPLSSAADLFSRGEPGRRKRKDMEVEEGINMEELESLMSQDLEDFDDPPPVGRTKQTHQAPADSSRKRQRLLEEEAKEVKETKFKEEEKSFSIRPEKLRSAPEKKSRDSPAAESGNKTEASVSEKPRRDASKMDEWKEEGLQPVMVKQEATKSNIDEDLPKQLILVEFRSLTVDSQPQAKARKQLDNGCTKNFKRFRKTGLSGTESSVDIIRGSGLLVHNRGRNTDVDEWLKDAAEEELQSQQEQSVGDDLFRYNPSKLKKRR